MVGLSLDTEAEVDGVNSENIETAVRLALRGELVLHAVSKGKKAVANVRKVVASAVAGRGPPNMRVAAGLKFPVALIGLKLERCVGRTCTLDAAVFLAAALESVATCVIVSASVAFPDDAVLFPLGM